VPRPAADGDFRPAFQKEEAMKTWSTLLLTVALAAGVGAGTAQAADTPAAGDAVLKEYTGGGITFRIGMAKGELMKLMAQHKEAKWFVQDLDAPPTDELLKMDKWTLAYTNGPNANPPGGVVTLIFVAEKVSKIMPGAQ